MNTHKRQSIINQINALSLDFGKVAVKDGVILIAGERVGLGIPRIGTSGTAKGLVMWRDDVNIIEGQVINRR